MRARAALLATIVAAAACGGTPQPGDPGYEYNVEGSYVVDFAANDGQTYSGTMVLTTGAGGVVSGSMSLTSPVSVDGTVEGTVVGAQLSLDVQYFIPDNQCGGVVIATGTIAQGGGTASGAASIQADDDCQGGPTSADFTLTR